jgi:hypothetical protein
MSYIKTNDLLEKSFIILQTPCHFLDYFSIKSGAMIQILSVNKFSHNNKTYANLKYKDSLFSIDLSKLKEHKIFIEGKDMSTIRN